MVGAWPRPTMCGPTISSSLVNDARAAVEITSKRGNAALMSADEYAAWQATAHLFSSPANGRRLLDAADAAARGDLHEHGLDNDE